MNVRPSFYAGVGTGIIVSTVILGVLQFFTIHQSSQQMFVLDKKIHTLNSQNLQLHQQIHVIEQTAIASAHQQALTVAHEKSTKPAHHALKTGRPVTLVIYPGMSISEIAVALSRVGIVPTPDSFVIAAIKYNHLLRAGKYTFRVNESFSQILHTMAIR